MPTLDFYRFRFYFHAQQTVHFPAGRAGNILRGACGIFLRKVAPAEIYSRVFEPGRALGPAPSGLSDWPRPFVFRTAEMDDVAAPSERFSFDLHLFDLREPVMPYFEAAFGEWAASGLGTLRTRARLDRVEPLGLGDEPSAGTRCSVSLDPDSLPVDRVAVRFVTPTELKDRGEIAATPEFRVLFSRIRDRVCTLGALFGQGPVQLDFRGMAGRAAQIRLVRCDLMWQRAARTSSRTGQRHPLGGFTGEAEYEGALQEFLPWLRAARWTGVGRQTVWGKGEIRAQKPGDRREVPLVCGR